ncbi:MAG: helix-turn-helix domain-containing protein [Candidatus Hydrogenedentes bacterium]|nr:helix-turn-helix domain-containing protein [Candidatus Hydrogenedentota bacterium]
MKVLAFFHSDAAQAALVRAKLVSGVSASIHFTEEENEGPCIAGTGQCEACRYVSEYPGGKAACRASRAKAFPLAMQRGKPTPFLCHMGFACVSVPMFAEEGRAFVLTFGPFCPAEAPQTLVDDALAGLAELGHREMPMFPVPLTDIPIVRAESVPALAQWTVEALETLWVAAQETEAVTEDSDPTPVMAATRRASRRTKSRALNTSPYRGAEIAAALAAGDQTLARSLVRAALAEVVSTGDAAMLARRARILALVGATLEAAENARLNTSDSWDEFPAFVSEVIQSRTDSDLIAAAMALLGIVLRRTRHVSVDGVLDELNRIVGSKLPNHVTLNEVAERLGRHPTAITHQLQRKFGLSYSQYVGRLRIDRAKELLRRTRLGVGDVAKRVGIRDASNFSKLFRKFEGVSPQQYRDHLRRHR